MTVLDMERSRSVPWVACARFLNETLEDRHLSGYSGAILKANGGTTSPRCRCQKMPFVTVTLKRPTSETSECQSTSVKVPGCSRCAPWGCRARPLLDGQEKHVDTSIGAPRSDRNAQPHPELNSCHLRAILSTDRGTPSMVFGVKMNAARPYCTKRGSHESIGKTLGIKSQPPKESKHSPGRS